MSSSDSIRRICAWCGRHMGGDRRSPRTSHGICATCRAESFGIAPEKHVAPATS